MGGRKRLSGRANVCICLLDWETIFGFLHARLDLMQLLKSDWLLLTI